MDCIFSIIQLYSVVLQFIFVNAKHGVSYTRHMELCFVKKYQEVGDVISFVFTSNDVQSWEAGQYINISMPDIPVVGADRIFTIASAPHEGYLLITTIITQSDYKQKMNTLQPGDVVEADQLGGDFVYQENSRKKLYLAGGIGITPYRSIVADRLYNSLPNNAALMYTGRPEGRPFVDELIKIANEDSTLQLFQFESERITFSTIKRDVPDYAERTIYLAGSQQFVETLGESLHSQGVPRSQLKYDWFDGYISLE